MGAISGVIWFIIIIDFPLITYFDWFAADLIFVPSAILAGVFTALVFRHRFSNMLCIIYGAIVFTFEIVWVFGLAASWADHIDFMIIPVAIISGGMTILGSWLTLKLFEKYKKSKEAQSTSESIAVKEEPDVEI